MINRIQSKINEFNVDGWLFYDFHGRDKLSYKVLNLDSNKLTTRRWYYFVPAKGSPVKVVHKIESQRLDQLDGEKYLYSSWRELDDILKSLLTKKNRIFMQYSPKNNIPTISTVDAGTIEKIKSYGVEVISSADIIQFFGAHISDEGLESHKHTGKIIHNILLDVKERIRGYIDNDTNITELDVQKYIIKRFKENKLTCDRIWPMVGINDHAANPHFENNTDDNYTFKEGDRLLIDLWAREDKKNSIYYDITWCFNVGNYIEPFYQEIFEIVRDARKRAVSFIFEQINAGNFPKGFQIDDICRSGCHIINKGYGKYFTHRTGHSIGTFVHGDGVNIDNLETKDDRSILPGCCFSIEPGIYYNTYGVRSEINVCITNKGSVRIIGPQQEEIVII